MIPSNIHLMYSHIQTCLVIKALKKFLLFFGFVFLFTICKETTATLQSHNVEFVGHISNVSVPVGREATLDCNVKNLNEFRITWVRVEPEVTLLTLQTNTIVKDNRIHVTHNNYKQWTLHISNVQKSDRGLYMCQINTNPMLSQYGCLDVLVPPSIAEQETSSDVVVDERSKLSLKCKAKGHPTPTITWRKEIKYNHSSLTGHNNVPITDAKGEYLNISQVTREHMGAYLCIASNGVLPSVSKRIPVQVNFRPKIRAVEQSLAASKDDNVTLECQIEASPKPFVSWIRQDQLILLPTRKYIITETINSYKTNIRLKIIAMENKDFGTYKCVAKNTLGESEGYIRVHEVLRTTALPVLVRSISTTSKPSKKFLTASTPTAFIDHGFDVSNIKPSMKIKEIAQKRDFVKIADINRISRSNSNTIFGKNNQAASTIKVQFYFYGESIVILTTIRMLIYLLLSN